MRFGPRYLLLSRDLPNHAGVHGDSSCREAVRRWYLTRAILRRLTGQVLPVMYNGGNPRNAASLQMRSRIASPQWKRRGIAKERQRRRGEGRFALHDQGLSGDSWGRYRKTPDLAHDLERERDADGQRESQDLTSCTLMRFVVPETPTGTPAVIITVSPGRAYPASTALFTAMRIISSVVAISSPSMG